MPCFLVHLHVRASTCTCTMYMYIYVLCIQVPGVHGGRSGEGVSKHSTATHPRGTEDSLNDRTGASTEHYNNHMHYRVRC